MHEMNKSLNYDWVEICDPQTRAAMYVHLDTGQYVQVPPPNSRVKPLNASQWWEFYDAANDRFYYYNYLTNSTVWERPPYADIIPLARLRGGRSLLEVGSDAQSCSAESEAAYRSNSTASTTLLHTATRSASTDSGQRSLLFDSTSAAAAAGNAGSRQGTARRRQKLQQQQQLQQPPLPPQPVYGTLAGNGHNPRHWQPSSWSPAAAAAAAAAAPAASAAITSSNTMNNYHSSNSSCSELDLGYASVPRIGARSSIRAAPMGGGLAGNYRAGSLAAFDRIDEQQSTYATTSTVVGASAAAAEAAAAAAAHLPPGWSLSLFRPEHSPVKLLSFTRNSLKRPLLAATDKSLKRDSKECFKLLQSCMGDRKCKQGQEQLMRQAVTRGWEMPELRDELLMQLCKQLTNNEGVESVHRGWELLAVCLLFFPPSITFAPYLEGFLLRHQRQCELPSLIPWQQLHACVAHRRLRRALALGPRRGRLPPSLDEVRVARDTIQSPGVFGCSLLELMEQQRRRHFPSLQFPWILTVLAQEILRLDGQYTDGIFRIAGDADVVNGLRVKLELWDLTACRRIDDPRIAATLLKQWLMELPEPLIPQACCPLACCARSAADAVRVLLLMPLLNRMVLVYMVSFLRQFIAPEVVQHTRMNMDNLSQSLSPHLFGRISPDPSATMNSVRREAGFITLLLLELPIAQDNQLDAAAIAGMEAGMDEEEEEVEGTPTPTGSVAAPASSSSSSSHAVAAAAATASAGGIETLADIKDCLPDIDDDVERRQQPPLANDSGEAPLSEAEDDDEGDGYGEGFGEDSVGVCSGVGKEVKARRSDRDGGAAS